VRCCRCVLCTCIVAISLQQSTSRQAASETSLSWHRPKQSFWYRTENFFGSLNFNEITQPIPVELSSASIDGGYELHSQCPYLSSGSQKSLSSCSLVVSPSFLYTLSSGSLVVSPSFLYTLSSGSLVVSKLENHCLAYTEMKERRLENHCLTYTEKKERRPENHCLAYTEMKERRPENHCLAYTEMKDRWPENHCLAYIQKWRRDDQRTTA
jgi:hypothetical protein